MCGLCIVQIAAPNLKAIFARCADVQALLPALLGVGVVIIIAALMVDLFNPNVGFFWLN